MSTTEIITVPKFKLKTVDQIKQDSGYSEISCSDYQYSGCKRLEILADKINNKLIEFSSILSEKRLEIPEDTIKLVGKNYALQQSFSSDNDSLYHKAIKKELNNNITNIDYIKILKNSKTLSSSDYKKLNNVLEGQLSEMQSTAKSVHMKLLNSEKKVINEKIQISLESLGYNVKDVCKSSETLIRGEKSDLSVAISIDKYNEISMDMAGFEGGKCKDEVNKIHREFSKNGIDVHIKQEQYHGKRDGGVLNKRIKNEFDILFAKSKNTKSSAKITKLKNLYTVYKQNQTNIL